MKFESRDPLKIALETAGQKVRSYFWVESQHPDIYSTRVYHIHLRSDDMQRRYEIGVTADAIESALECEKDAIDSIVRYAIGVMQKTEERYASQSQESTQTS